MDGIERQHFTPLRVKGELLIRQPLAEFIDEVNPPVHLSCDFLGDVLAFGLQVYPLRVYESIRELKDGNSPSGRGQEA